MTSPPIDPDAERVARLRRGDERAFREIWEAYHGRLIEFAFRYVRSYDAAADVVQQVYFQLWLHRSALPDPLALPSYLYSRVRFRALRDLKHERVEQAYSLAIGAQRTAEPLVEHNAGASAVETGELLRAVQAAVEAMTPRVREIFLMHREDGLTAPQIAATLGISVQVVYNQLSKALKALAAATGALRDR